MAALHRPLHKVSSHGEGGDRGQTFWLGLSPSPPPGYAPDTNVKMFSWHISNKKHLTNNRIYQKFSGDVILSQFCSHKWVSRISAVQHTHSVEIYKLFYKVYRKRKPKDVSESCAYVCLLHRANPPYWAPCMWSQFWDMSHVPSLLKTCSNHASILHGVLNDVRRAFWRQFEDSMSTG